MSSVPVTFRALRRQDFALLAGWLAEPLVARWWNHDSSLQAVERDFGPSIDRHDPTELFIAEFGTRPFGLIQRYPFSAYPEYIEELSHACPVPPNALSIDYLIGDPQVRGLGLGAAMIAEFVARSWTSHPEAEALIVPISVGNVRSWRALERAGFDRIAAAQLQPDNPRDSRDHYVYRIERPRAGRSSDFVAPRILTC